MSEPDRSARRDLDGRLRQFDDNHDSGGATGQGAGSAYYRIAAGEGHTCTIANHAPIAFS